jgi:hypothetical protein
MSVTAFRLSLLHAGFSPVPATGKKVLLEEWQTKHATTPGRG